MQFRAFFKINWLNIGLIFCLILLTQTIDVISTYMISPIINAISGANYQLFALLLVAQLGLSLALNAAFNGSSYLYAKQTQTYLHHVREQMSEHFFKGQAPAASQMINHYSNDLEIITDDYLTSGFYFFNDLVNTLLIIGTLFTLHWSLVILSLSVSLISFLLPHLFSKRTNAATRQVSTASQTFLKTIEKWAAGIAELHRYHRLNPLSSAIATESSKLERKIVHRAEINSLETSLQGVVTALGIVSVMAISGYLYYLKQMSLGGIVTASYFSANIFGCLDNLSGGYNSMLSTKELRAQLAKLQAPVENQDCASLTQVETIKISNLSYQYPQGSKITYPDLTIRSGQKVLLTGASGSGKSTLIKLILGELLPSTGKIDFLDQQGKVLTIDQNQLGYLAQDLHLFPGNIVQNITLGSSALENRTETALALADLPLASNHLQATELIDPDNTRMSGGQQQKLVLARHFAHQLPISILDEPTSAIDQAAQDKILANLVREPGTLIVIAHNLTAEQKALFDQEINLTKEDAQNDL